jgi:hypothetical protein
MFGNIFEGGNVFKDAKKQPLTTRINKENIKPSVAFVEKILGFRLDGYLGTTGKKESSGDIDISVDESKHDKKDVANKLKQWAKEQGQAPGEWVKLSGTNVHFKTPIRDSKGRHTGGFAQLDLMFGNPAFQKWSMRGEPGNEYKGVHRHIIMASIAKAHGMKWSYRDGLVNRVTNEVISQDPNQIVRTLLPGYTANPADLSVKSILDYVYTKYKGQDAKIEALIGEAAATLAEHYGVKLPMPNDSIVHETNDTDSYFLARLRDKIMSTGSDVIMEKTIVTEGKLRDMNHIEDLVLDEGPAGLIKAIKILRSFAEGSAHTETTIKWDGSPSIVFGRNEQGRFVLTDKSGFTAKGYNGKATSAKELGQMFAGRAAPMDDNRKQFVSNMMDIFDEYQKATPADFRGYMMGDLMYYNTPDQDKDSYVFQPNTVRYEVRKDSKLGQRVGQSKTGVVVHKYTGDQYSSTEEAIKQMQGKEVFVIPPVYVQHPSTINTKPVDKIETYAKQHINEIKNLFDPTGLKGIANIHALMYKYINNKVDSGLERLGSDFTDWLNTETLTEKKRQTILAYLQQHKVGVKALWTLISMIMKLKDYLITEFDAHPSDVQQSIAGRPGGEGYVVKHPEGAVKLVPRGTFTAANRAAHR